MPGQNQVLVIFKVPTNSSGHVPRVLPSGPQLGSVIRGQSLTCSHVHQLPSERGLGVTDLVVRVSNKLGSGIFYRINIKINLSGWGHLSFRPVWVNILSRED